MQSVQKQRALYFKYGTCTPDDEFRTIYIRGVSIKKSIREIVDFREGRLKELEAQREKLKQIEETRKYNLNLKAEKERQIQECREYNLKQKAKNGKENIKDLIAMINLKSTVR